MAGTTAAVVGSAGFLGGHLVAALRRAGVQTATLTRTTPLVSFGSLCPQLRAAATVFFLVGTGTPAGMQRESHRAAEEFVALHHLLTALSLRSQPPVLVLAGSGGVVYDAALPPPYDESTPTAPTTEYGWLKIAEERLLQQWAGGPAPAPRPVVLRLANVYGPGQRAGTGQGVIAHWLHAASRREPFQVFGDPESIRDYLYVDDAVDAFVKVHLRGGQDLPRLLNIGSASPTSLRELTALVLGTTGTRLADVHAHPARAVDRQAFWLDITRARTTLDWQPTVPLAEGLARTWRQIEHGSATSAGRGHE